MLSAARRLVRAHGWPAAAGLVLGLVALGPALRPGYVLSYDMVFVPSPPIGGADVGLGGGPPRAVPSDLFVALAARVMPADLAQKLILLAVFVLACAGAAALVAAGFAGAAGSARAGLLPARLAAGVCYCWNPFVAERLIMGQWALLLGYAGLPWVVRELRAPDGRIRYGRFAAAMVPATIGGFGALSITALTAVPVAAARGGGSRIRRLAVTLAALAAASLPWLIPALLIPVHTDPSGAYAFAARSDTVFGPVASLLMLGGSWNAEVVPAEYGGPASAAWLAVVVIAGLGYLRAARPARVAPGLGWAGGLGFAIAAIGLLPVGRTALHAAIAAWPGFGMLRDGQQFLAPLALLLSVGLGSAVQRLVTADRAGSSQRRTDLAAGLAVMAVLAPVLLLPGLAWGAASRLHAVKYPADWMAARSVIDGDRAGGSVLLLPWAQYRRYPWNGGEAVYDPWTRLVARTVIWNDALQVGSLTVGAERPSTIRVGPVITSGRPMTSALRCAGVRFVLVDAGPLLRGQAATRAARARLPGATVVLASGDLVVFRISRAGPGPSAC